MTAMANIFAPVTPISSTANEHSTANPATSRSSFFRNRFSNASFLSLSSVRTLLPQYSIVNTLEEPPATPLSIASENHELISRSPSSQNSPLATEPPRYSLLHPSVLTWRASTATPFEVEGGPPADEFRYSYPIRTKNPWATLHLHTRVPVPGTYSGSLQSQPRVPKFCSCDPVTGAVQLDLDGPQSIHQISITLNGSVVLSSHTGGSLLFLRREFTVWDKSMGDPRQSDSRLLPDQTTVSSVVDANSIFPFRPHTRSSVISPTPPLDTGPGPHITEKPQRRWTSHFTSASNESPSSSKISDSEVSHMSFGSEPPLMPQTFMEKGIDPNIAYDISVRIVHGRFKASNKIKTNITYLPASEPLPASQKRREAYEAGALVPCPMDDPEGWLALPTVKIYGMVRIDEKLLPTRVDCTLYIAQPLTYTRGSVIPCFIAIHSEGVEIADLLSSNERPTVRLLRRVWHPKTEYGNPSQGISMRDYSSINGSWTYTFSPNSDMKLVTHEVGCANWWIPSKHIVQDPHVRFLEGEIHLSADLQPSCGFQSFRIEYAVELMSFRTANFTPEVHPPSRKGDNVITSNPVEITTLYRQDEPVPTACSEPQKSYSKLLVSSDERTIL